MILDRTAFYAESGGQPWDTGTLGDARVVAVIEDGPDVLHVLDRPLAGERVHGRVDAERRRDHMQQHHGQHLLSRAFVEVAQAETVAFHLGGCRHHDRPRPLRRRGRGSRRRAPRQRRRVGGPSRARDRAERRSGARRRASSLPRACRAASASSRPKASTASPAAGRTRERTAEVGVVLVTALERYKGGTRVHFVCGDRATRVFAERQQVVGQLVATLSAPLDELPAAAQRLKDELAASDRRAKALLARALEGDARRLLAEAQGTGPAPTLSSPAIVVSIFDGWPADDLRVLAQQLVALAPCVALLASRSDKAQLVFAQSEGLPHDVPALLKAAVLHLDGRGGGRGNLAQGGGDRVERLEEALAQARASLGAAR